MVPRPGRKIHAILSRKMQLVIIRRTVYNGETMSVTGLLYHLEELDSEIERQEDALAKGKAALGDHRVLDAAKARMDAARASLDELKRRHRAAEAEVDDIIARIQSDEEKLYSGKITSPKELSSLQQEVTLEKSRSDELENKALEIIEKVEEAEQGLNAVSAAFEKLEKDWQANQEKLAVRIEELTASLAVLRDERQEQAEQIDPADLKLYTDIRARKKPAVSRVEQGICQSCRIQPSSSAMQRARAGQPVTCSCGRILYIS